ncbi:MAG: FtsB family cell division protein [Terriglobia bacterium]
MNGFEWGNKNFRRAVKLAIALAMIFLIVHGVLGSDGLFTYLQKRREYNSLHEQIVRTKKQNELLQKDVEGLRSNPATIERYAREDLHMARQKELIYMLPQPQKAPSSGYGGGAQPPPSRAAP